MISPLPFAREYSQDALQSCRVRRIVGERKGLAAGSLKELAVAQRIGDVKAEGAGLAGPEEFAGAAQLQIGFGDFEAVGGAHHGFEAGACFVGHADRADENAVGFLRAAANASAKLMQLRQAEALGMLDDHYGGVGNIDFDYGGGDEDLDFIFVEALHDVVFFFAGETAVQQAEAQLGKHFARQAFVLVDGGFQLELRFFDDGIDDVGLVAELDFATNAAPNAGKMRLGGEMRFDGRAAGWELVENGDVQITIKGKRKCSRNGRCGENKHV